MRDKNVDIPLEKATFFKFRRLYLMAIMLIAGTIIIVQILIQKHLNSQLNDSSIINISGRQRMLSQKLIKEVLYLNNFTAEEERLNRASIIKSDNKAFLKAHLNLQDEFSDLGALIHSNPEIKELFKQIEKSQKEIVNISGEVTDLILENPLISSDSLQVYINQLEKAEHQLLRIIDEIVFKFDEISQQKVEDLKQKEYVLLAISLLILLFEILFLFKPISIHIKNVIGDLIKSKIETQENAKKIEELYIAKEASLQELKGLNYALDNAALFASVGQDGSLVHMSKKFKNLLGIDKQDIHRNLEELLLINEGEQQTLKELLKGNRRAIWIGEVQVTTANNGIIWLEMSIIPMNNVNTNQRVLVLCNDINKRKESQKVIDGLNERRFQEQVGMQKVQASQIVEAQEEERKRIAKDIHDGIGQMLTALKFNIESIKPANVDTTTNKVEILKALLGNLIKEVRTVTFNLTPPELIDFGIVPAISKLVEQLSNFTEKNIFFENKTDFKGRFDSLIETNLYRVVQEAVNNAIKYAESNYILISISHSDQLLSIVIDDDGKGFDAQKLLKKNKEEGMGLFFMRERISYINGRIFINSSKNSGTRITININLPKS